MIVGLKKGLRKRISKPKQRQMLLLKKRLSSRCLSAMQNGKEARMITKRR